MAGLKYRREVVAKMKNTGKLGERQAFYRLVLHKKGRQFSECYGEMPALFCSIQPLIQWAWERENTMKNPQHAKSNRKFLLIGLLISVLFAFAAIFYEPRLLPLAFIAGPALVALVFPPPGRRVYRELSLAGLAALTTATLMRLTPPTG